MIRHNKVLSNLLIGRGIHTSPRLLSFKLKLTDELIQKSAEEQKNKQAKPQPEKALHTRESSLIMGRVSSDRYEQVIKVGIPKHRLNDRFLLYVREQDNVHALDENNLCKPGDWVLLRRQEKPIDEGVEHKVERVVYQYGKYIDPTTGRRTYGIFYDDEVERLEKIKLDL